MKILVIAGTRPNFMKAAPLITAAKASGIEALLIHTGQHYDDAMSKVFFDELGLPRPHRNLDVGSGSHGEVTARCLEGLEKVFVDERPDWVLVVGDVNSTLAGALAAAKLRIPLAHIEAGLRSFDRDMPEEINRVVTDAVSDLLFVTEPTGVKNLLAEGRSEKAIHLVGNVMIDTLDRFLPFAKKKAAASTFGLKEHSYALLTLHRPSNVDQPRNLQILYCQLAAVQERFPVLFPIHPRTRAKMEATGMLKYFESLPQLRLTDPLGYIDFLSLMVTARVVLTDSGGIQEETTVLGVPCLTLRDNTERPITIEQGTNQLVGASGEKLIAVLDLVHKESRPAIKRPHLWDGKASERIVRILVARSE